VAHFGSPLQIPSAKQPLLKIKEAVKGDFARVQFSDCVQEQNGYTSGSPRVARRRRL
jgi:hypothetical protein